MRCLALALAVGGCAADDGGAADATTQAASTGSPATGSDTVTGVAESTGMADSTGSDSGPAFEGRLVVTADWQAGTLSLLDHAALVGGAATRDEMLVGTVDLSAWAPGPLEVEIAPDARTAVVTASPGFFDTFIGGAIGAAPIRPGGALLIVDLVTQEVLAELAPPAAPMGIAIAPDGTRAYTANFGVADARGDTVSVIDLASLAIVDELVVGEGPEQIALDESGALAILNVDSTGSVRVFETADPAGTLTPPLELADDPSDVAFIPGTDLAAVSLSTGPSTWAVVDVSDPAAPVVVEIAPQPGGVPYAVSHIPGTTDFIMVLTTFSVVSVIRVDVSTDPSTIVWSHDESINGFPLSAAIDADAGLVIVDVPGANQLLVLGLDGSEPRLIPWLDAASPTYVAIAPA